MSRMSIFLSLVFALVFAVSCENSNVKEEPKKEEFRPLIVRKDGQYIEYYPGHKQIKMKGREDADGNRAGIWKLFSQDGVELSITVYTKGKKDGHIVVRYPNGMPNYVGEYVMDERAGEWKFYAETGELLETIVYDEPTKENK
jgi:antitoxin component YwqK of YwqJK toxin-antitoxin module